MELKPLTLHPSLRNDLSLVVWPILAIPLGLWLLKSYIWETMSALWIFIYVVVLLLFPAYGWLKTRFHTYVVQAKSVMSRKGLLSRFTSEIRVGDIRNVKVRQSLLQRIMGIGDVGFSSSAGDEEEVSFVGITNPEAVRQAVQARMAAEEEKAEAKPKQPATKKKA